jgi:hypothetical protein
MGTSIRPAKVGYFSRTPTLGSVLLFIVSPTGSEVLPTIIDTEYRHLLGPPHSDGHSATKRDGAQARSNVIAWRPAMWKAASPSQCSMIAFVKRLRFLQTPLA